MVSLEHPQIARVYDSGELEVTDAIYALNFLFLGGPSPPSPFADCTFDPTTDGLSCRAHAPCEGS